MPKRKRQNSTRSSASNKSPRKSNLNATSGDYDTSNLEENEKKVVEKVVFTFDVDCEVENWEISAAEEFACLTIEESQNENEKPEEVDFNSYNVVANSSPVKRVSPLSPTLFNNVLQHQQPSTGEVPNNEALSSRTPNNIVKTEDGQATTRRCRSSRRKRVISESHSEVKDADVVDAASLLTNDEKSHTKNEESRIEKTSQKPLDPNPSDKIKLPEANFRVLDEYNIEENPPPGSDYRVHKQKSREELCQDVLYELDEMDICWLKLMNHQRSEATYHFYRDVKNEEMELLMDRLEKESYFDLQNAGMGQPGESDEDAVCCICLDGESDNSNLIIFCDMCNIPVHQDCFGVPFVPEGTWLCRRCSIIPHGVVECVLCPNTDGAFKQTVDGRWCHVLCALWIPEVRFANPSFLEPVDDIDDIPAARWKLVCSLCKQKGVGACIQCHLRSCVTAFHVTCAQMAGLSMKMCDGGRWLKASCDKHTSERERQILQQKVETMKKVLAEKSSNEPEAQFPTFPMDRIGAVCELVSFPGKKYFLKRLLAYWKLKRKSRGGAALLRNLESLWIADKKEPPAPPPLQEDDPVHTQMCREAYMMKMRSNCKMLKEYCGLVKEHAFQENEERKARYNIEILRLEAFHFSGYDVYHDILQKLGAKDKHGTFANPVTDEDAPDYSTTIKNPMDLSTMREKLLQLQYDNLEDLEADFGLMINNCMTYNKKSTPYYKDAVKLMDYGTKVFEEARLTLERRRLEEKESRKISEEPGPDCSIIKTELDASADSKELNYRPLQKRLISILEKLTVHDKEGIFAEPVDVREVPDYLDVIKEPMDFSTMRNKINSNQYSSIEDFEADFFLMTSNCLKYNKEKSLFYKCGEKLNVIGKNILEKAKQDKCFAVGSELTEIHAVKTENNNYKSAPVSKKGVIIKDTEVVKISEADLIVDVLKNLIRNDVEEIFAEPVSDEDAPEYSTMIKTPMDFSTMQKKLSSNMYSTLEDLEKDFSLIIDNCKRYNSSGTMHFNYAIKMKRAGNSLFHAARKRLAASCPTKTNECDQSNVD